MCSKYNLQYFRYRKSWGWFWAATRNLVRARGLLAFKDHFSVPSSSQLTKYQKQIVDICGLSSISAGKPGVQSRAAELWVNSKKLETASSTICVSVSIDGKRIAMTEDGLEDMAGVGKTLTKEDDLKLFESELKRLEKLVKQNDRKSLFSVFDSLTLVCQQLCVRTVAVEELISKNNKLLDKNPRLSKYIFVLRSQLDRGEKLLVSMNELQNQLITAIVDKRNCRFLLPVNNAVDLDVQANFCGLTNLDTKEEAVNRKHINNASVNCVVNVSWPDLLPKLTRPVEDISRCSETFGLIIDSCYLASTQIYAACGFGKLRPLQDMKDIHAQSHSTSSNINIQHHSTDAIATFCAIVAPVIFGNNCTVYQAGIHIKNGISAVPDLLVRSTSTMIDYTVRIIESKSDVFNLTQEDISTCLGDSYICNSSKGSILLYCSQATSVAFMLPTNTKLVQDMLAVSDSYIKMDKCISRRGTEMLKKIKQLEGILLEFQERITILGCYPLVRHLESQVPVNAGDHATTSKISTLKLRSVFSDTRSFLSNKARELVAINISDLSGNHSSTPHTIMGATYLTSSSLKVVGEKCLAEVCDMLEQNNVEILNLGLDGESLHMASVLPDGSPGTLLSLVKHLHDNLKKVKKDRLADFVASNPKIKITTEAGHDDLDEDFDQETLEKDEEEIEEDILDSVALLENRSPPINHFTVEDVEEMLSDVMENPSEERKCAVKALKLSDLRILCLRHVIPSAKKKWLQSVLGKDYINITWATGSNTLYFPNSIFQKTKTNMFRTVSFDFAHILNLFREHASKGKLSKLGLKKENLNRLSTLPDFSYLKRIIAIKGNKLEFDSMNQKASALLFSEKTAHGLESVGDKTGSECVRVICYGLTALDESGIETESRIKHIIALKSLLEDKSDFVERLKRPDMENMTNELLQMTMTTLDSYIYNCLNLQFFNVRRKGKLSKHSFYIKFC